MGLIMSGHHSDVACEHSGPFPTPLHTPLEKVFAALAPYAVSSCDGELQEIGAHTLTEAVYDIIVGQTGGKLSITNSVKLEKRDDAYETLSRVFADISDQLDMLVRQVEDFYHLRFPASGKPAIPACSACDRVLLWILGLTSQERKDMTPEQMGLRIAALKQIVAKEHPIGFAQLVAMIAGRMSATIDGSMKSTLGKLLEGVFLRTLLKLLGFEEVERVEELSDGKFTLSNVREQHDARRNGDVLPEADATVQVGGTRVIIEFGGAVDKTEVVREKLTRHQDVAASIIITWQTPSESSNLGQQAARRAEAEDNPTYILGVDNPLWLSEFCQRLAFLSDGEFVSPLPDEATSADIVTVAAGVFDMESDISGAKRRKPQRAGFDQPTLFGELAA